MLFGAIAAFVAAAIIAVLVGLGFWHARRTAEETKLFDAKAAPVTEPVIAS
jgi:cytochrome oxidase assembly protein ShyY1